MPTTYEDIIVAGHGYSSKSRPDQIATKATELLKLASRAVRGIYAMASRVNPEYFGDVVAQAYVGGVQGWPRPAQAQTVFHIEVGVGGPECAVVPLNDRKAEEARPSVYMLGKVYRIAASTLGPLAGDMLALYYSKLPAKPAALTDVIDATWEESFDEFLSLEVALYLALKDGRSDEVALLTPDRDREAKLAVEFLAYAMPLTSYRFGQPRMVPFPSLLPLLAGGKE